MAYQFTQTGAEIQDILDLARNDIAAEYDPTASYVVGDYCTYEDSMYKCTGATTGTFAPAKWTAVTAGDEIAALSSSMVYGGANITGGTANDTFVFWRNKGTCYSVFSMTGMLNGQPYRYGILESIVCGDEIYQLWHTQPHGGISFRGGHAADTAMPSTWRQVIIGSDIANMAQVFYSSWSASFSFPCTKGGILTINGGATVFSFWWPGGNFAAVSIKGDAASAFTWDYTNGTVTVTASGNRAWTFVGN